MKLKFKLSSSTLLISLALSASSTASEHLLKISMAVNETDPTYKGALQMKEAVEKRTNGELEIQIYPNSQLGPVEDVQEQAMFGENIALITDSGRLSVFSKEVGIIGVAYAAKDYNQMKKLIESKSFKEWENNIQDEGLNVLSFNWYQGSRGFMTNKLVNKPSDLEGLIIRTPGAKVWTESVSALGATPTSLPWADTYTAMQQGTIDGFEQQPHPIVASKLYETFKYYIETDHIQLMTALVISDEWLKKLPQEYQTILKEEAVNAGNYASQVTINEMSSYKQNMADNYGIEFIKVNKAPFMANAKKAMKSLGYEAEYKTLQREIK
ncbi:C4-dicarboxylate TRAP transporter substrate-binding protein [Vibrio tasmaniensis]|uniref:C4-dicarboxylate TRAP transporter substrate-binding protein n=1 Tax=Vibrio tasmaniensis TaxID=212663 RepID=UPI0014369799|nr:C4-dicarboxylate TRAP transporter substrate-binding protein [Vibrio tasmaniensis]